jgi:chaperonin GroES
MLELTTLQDLVIVSKINPADKTRGGIWIPDSSLFKRFEERGVYFGEVLVTGPDCKSLKTGELVMFNRMTYILFSYKGTEYRCLHEKDVIATVDEIDATVGL